MNKNFKFLASVLAFVFCLSAAAFGQGTTGSIEGTVTDANGARVPNASVTVESSGSTAGFRRTVTADSSGYINIANVPPGTYKVTISATNFAETTQSVAVAVDRATPIEAVLQVSGVGVDVTVTGDAAATVDTTNSTVDTTINKRIFDALPKGTTFGSLLKTAPNVRPEPLAAGFQIDGASGAENVFIVDGQEVTNFRTGQLNSNNNLPFELLQEVQVKSTGFNAEYGGATGGVINAVTAGGNNDWRGNFGVSFTPSRFQGSPRTVLNRFSVTDTPEYFQPNKDGGTGFFPVASVSGPILKDRLWFSAIYAPQIQETTRRIDYFGGATPNSPVGRTIASTDTYSTNVRTDEMFLRLDAQPMSKLRLFGTFLYNPIIQEGVLPANTEGLGGRPQSALGLVGSQFLGQQGGRQNSNSINGQATWTPTNSLVLNFRAGRSFLNEKLNSYGLPRITRFICAAGWLANTVTDGVTTPGCSSGFQNIANNSQINYDVSTRTTFDADASFVGIDLGGRHNFKFGYQLNRLFNTVDRGYADLGIVQLFYGRSIAGLTGQSPTSVPDCDPVTAGNQVCGSGLIQRFGTIGEASSRNQSIFVQDSWQIARRLTLNLGIRFENEIVPNFGQTGSQAIEFGWGDKLAPRLGFALDVFGDGKTKLFGSYGWFYDRFKYELPRGSFGGDFFRNDYFEILPSRGLNFQNYNFNSILGGRADELGGTCPIVGGPGFSICQFDFRIATNLTGADIFETGAIDPDIKAARQSEYTIGIERELARNFVLAGRYTHKQVDRAIEDVGVFNANGSEAYIIGNPGFGLVCEIADTANLPCAKAKRDYDAIEVRVDKRATKYFFNASYTWSRLFGNYSGLASSDEFGRSSPNVNRFFDLPMLGFNANGDPDDGRLATDRPHVVKAYGGYTFDWGGTNATTVSAFTTFQSGTPLTTQYTTYAVTSAVLFERGDLGRTEMFTETDLGVSHRYKFGRDGRFSLEPFVNIRNLFDEKNVLTVQTAINTLDFRGSTAVFPGTPSATNPNAGNPSSPLVLGGCSTCTSEAAVFQAIFNGPGIQQAIVNYLSNNNIGTTISPFGQPAGSRVQTPVAERTRNDYGLPNGFQAPREVRFGARFFF